MKFEVDNTTIKETREPRKQWMNMRRRYKPSFDIAGGQIGTGTVIRLGSQYIKIDGKNRRIIINDGLNDRVLIGYQKEGF